MATIELDRKFLAVHGERRYRVEFDDDDGLTRERYFDSLRAAERYALEIEARLLNEKVQSCVDPTNVISGEDERGNQ